MNNYNTSDLSFIQNWMTTDILVIWFLPHQGGHPKYFNHGMFERKRMNIYVGNIAYKLSEEELRSAFEEFGTVDSVRCITDRETGRSKGFGFVEMPNSDEASNAIDGLNGKDLLGRTLTVNEARPREERSPRGGGFSKGY